MCQPDPALQSRFPTTAMREEVGRQIGLSARKVQVRRTVGASGAAYLILCLVLFYIVAYAILFAWDRFGSR